MRRALLALVLVANACALGSGIGPGDTLPTTTTVPATTTTSTAPHDEIAAATEAVGRFYDALSTGDVEAAQDSSNGSRADIAAMISEWRDDLGADEIAFEVGAAEVTGERATAAVAASISGPGIGVWEYTILAHIVHDGDWRVEWSPSLLHPELEDGDRLEVRADWPSRGSILAVDGSALARQGALRVIGVVPQWAEDMEGLADALESIAGIDPETVATELARPGVQPDWFVPVGSIEASRTEDAAALLEIPGVQLQDGVGRILPEGESSLVGRVAPITAEQLAAWGPPYAVGDEVGRSGIEAAFQARLAGLPDLRVTRVNRYGRELGDLHTIAGEPSQDVHTTLDPSAQRVVDDALQDVGLPAAVVLLDVETGGVRASASRPTDGLDRAFLGQYPPGSSFKVVTASALLGLGLTPSSAVDCPADIVVGGLRIRNAGGRDLGGTDLRTAFAESCNTTFASLAGGLLRDGRLAVTARTLFGFDTGYDPGLPTATSRFPDPTDTAELGAQAIGQGRVLVTPLHQASVAAAVAGGGWLAPTLVADNERIRIPLDPEVAAGLAAMMRRVVTDGTGTAADVDGIEVAGKTGSAEYGGTGTHAWFIAFWDGYAIAVIVEGGGSGGQVAAPIAARIIESLGG